MNTSQDLPKRSTAAPDTEHRYEIRDDTGVHVATHVRLDQPDGKRIWWERPDGSKGLPCSQNDLPLYGSHKDFRHTAVIVEGEKAAEALWAWGIPALGTFGAGTTPTYLDLLIGKRVILWPDADDAGRLHMRRISEALTENSAVYWIEPPESAPRGFDAADGNKELAIALIGEAIEVGPLLTGKVSDQTTGASVTKQSARFRTAHELAQTTPEHVEWVAEPWVPKGAAVELAGKIKASGKTTFALALARAVIDGGPFLGTPTSKGPVVYLTEQPDASFRIALRRAHLDDAHDFHFLSFHDCRALTWADVMAEALALAQDIGAELLVVDTLAQFAGIRGDSENDAGAALAAMQPVQAATGAGVAVLLLRHERKGGGEIGESARGSSAFAGVVDVILRLARPEGNHQPEVRRLDSLSRFDETPDELMAELAEDGTFQSLGTASDMSHREALDAIRETAMEPMTDKELTDATGLARTSIRRAKDELVRAGELTLTGSGKRNDPYRVVLSEKLCDRTTYVFGHKAIKGASEPPFLADQTSTPTGHKASGDPTPEAETIFGGLA